MAVLHDFRCSACGKVFEMMVPWDTDRIPCPDCTSTASRSINCMVVYADRVFISHREYRAQAFDPVLIYRDASGHVRFPGRNQGETPKGYEPVYLRTRSEVDKFTKSMNARERERYFRHKERNEARFAPWLASARSELRQQMQHMSPAGRALAEAAMRDSDRQSSSDARFDSGCHFEAFEYDASNREAHYDRDMKRGK